MKKIIVIGCPGSGKSTFARALHDCTELPLFYMDQMYWNADRTIVDRSVFLRRLEHALMQDAWIIDGNYGSTMERRMQACDTVFFLDYPPEVCLDGVRTRKGKPRADMPWVETEEDPEFMEFIKSYCLTSRPKVLALLEKYHDRNIMIFQSRKEADNFLKQLQHCKSGI